MKKKLNKSWKINVLKEYWDKPDQIGRDVARKHGVAWSSMFDFKQLIKSGQLNYNDAITKPKILFVDIETAPTLAHIWSLWDQRVGLNQIIEDWYMLSWSAMWLDSEEDDVMHDRLINYLPSDCIYHEHCDEDIIRSLWDLFDQADIIIGHNIKKFDDKKFKARCLFFGLNPPSSYRVVDTLDIAKQAFSLTSNKLDYLASYLGLPNKVAHEGHGLWVKCMIGDEEAWDTMTEYNNYDVVLLRDVYFKIRKWAKNHPNVALFYDDDLIRCTVCGSSEIKSTGNTVKTNLGEYKEVRCKCCGKLSRKATNILKKDKRESLLRNII